MNTTDGGEQTRPATGPGSRGGPGSRVPSEKQRRRKLTLNLTERMLAALEEYRKAERRRSLNDAIIHMIEDATGVREEES